MSSLIMLFNEQQQDKIFEKTKEIYFTNKTLFINKEEENKAK